LLEAQTDFNVLSVRSWVGTALRAAVLNKDIDLVRLLIANGADPSVVHKSKNVSDGRESPIQDIALKAAMDTSSINVEIVQALLEAGAIINGPSDYDRGVIFQAAAASGNIKVVQMLLNAGADVNGRMQWFWGPTMGVCIRTALQKACATRNYELVRPLLKAAANVNPPVDTVCEKTALQQAVAANDVRVVRLLLQHGADVKAAATIWG
jgi:cytohesin